MGALGRENRPGESLASRWDDGVHGGLQVRQSGGGPFYGVEEELPVSLRPFEGRGDKAHHRKPQCLGRFGHLQNHPAVLGSIPNHTSPADLSAPHLELGFDEAKQPSALLDEWREGGEY